MEHFTCKNYKFLEELGISESNLGVYRDGEWSGNGNTAVAVCPHDNKSIAQTKLASIEDYNKNIASMKTEQDRWALLPAPQRGEIVRQIGEELRKYKV